MRVGGGARERVEEDLVLELRLVRRVLLDVDEVALGKELRSGELATKLARARKGTNLVELAVRSGATSVVGLLVDVERCGLDGSEEVLGVDDERLSTDLTETERGEETSLDAVGLDRLGRVDEVLESAELLRDVVGVPARMRGVSDEGRSCEEREGTHLFPGTIPDWIIWAMPFIIQA